MLDRQSLSATVIPPSRVQAVARWALDYRAALPQRYRGGTAVAIRRAVQLANREPVSIATLLRMRSFFDRNARYAHAPRLSRAFVAWVLWGGSAANRWSRAVLRARGL